jgi:hypothetical protein
VPRKATNLAFVVYAAAHLMMVLLVTPNPVEHVLVRKLYVPIDVLQPGRLAKADELIMDEAIVDVVEHVDVLHNGLTLILYKVLDKSISADGNTKANVAVNHKRRGREQGTEVRGGEVGINDVLCCSVRISRRDTLDENRRMPWRASWWCLFRVRPHR